MSRYLISRIEACHEITFRPASEIESLEGDSPREARMAVRPPGQDELAVEELYAQTAPQSPAAAA